MWTTLKNILQDTMPHSLVSSQDRSWSTVKQLDYRKLTEGV